MRTRVDLLRHATAQSSHSAGDAARTLTPEGVAAVRLLGVELGRAGWRPDRAFSSPYARARDTAALVLGTAGVPFAAGILSELEPETEPDHASRALAALLDGARHLLVVGHQPLLGRLTGYWTGALATLEPGELVHLEFDSLPGPGAGRLVDRIAPRRSV